MLPDSVAAAAALEVLWRWCGGAAGGCRRWRAATEEWWRGWVACWRW